MKRVESQPYFLPVKHGGNFSGLTGTISNKKPPAKERANESKEIEKLSPGAWNSGLLG